MSSSPSSRPVEVLGLVAGVVLLPLRCLAFLGGALVAVVGVLGFLVWLVQLVVSLAGGGGGGGPLPPAAMCALLALAAAVGAAVIHFTAGTGDPPTASRGDLTEIGAFPAVPVAGTDLDTLDARQGAGGTVGGSGGLAEGAVLASARPGVAEHAVRWHGGRGRWPGGHVRRGGHRRDG